MFCYTLAGKMYLSLHQTHGVAKKDASIVGTCALAV